MQGSFDAFAMGNFPFATDYMVGEGQGELPAWPMRAACERMSSLAPSSAGHAATTSKANTNPGQHQQRQSAVTHGHKGLRGNRWHHDHDAAKPESARQAEPAASSGGMAVPDDAPDLLARLASAASILYNASGTASCFSLDLSGPAAGSVGAWDYQVNGYRHWLGLGLWA